MIQLAPRTTARVAQLDERLPNQRSQTRSRRLPAKSRTRKADLAERAERLLDAEVSFIANESFIGRRDDPSELSALAMQIELGGHHGSAGGNAESALGSLCATPLLSPEEEQELFRRMNFCKYRANAVRSRLSRRRPDAAKVQEAEEYLARAERLRNHLIQANTRLVVSITRKFVSQGSGFDDLLGHGIDSLMHAIEKFDYSRGYRFSTYATCAVRRELYRLVVRKQKDSQRFVSGVDDALSQAVEEGAHEDRPTEEGWKRLTRSIETMLDRLDDRERFIVTHRFGLEEESKPSSYSVLGDRLGISKERVRQLANRAMEKLREWAAQDRLDTLLA